MAEKRLVAEVAAWLATSKTTKQALCELMGVKTTNTLNAKLEGTSEMSVPEALALAKAMGTDVNHIADLLYA